MKSDQPADVKAARYQEVLFALAMGVIAVIGRDDPMIRYPQMLWALAAILAFNFLCHRALKVWTGSTAPMVSASVNLALCSVVVGLSGGERSSFWPLYLLPITTACLHLERRHVAAACAAAAAFLACFYLEALWDGRAWGACEFVMKLSVLGFAASVTAPLAFRERVQRRALAAGREELKTLARSLDEVMPGVLHALNNPLTIILGSVELMLQEAPAGSLLREDLERVLKAAQRCGEIGGELRDYALATRPGPALPARSCPALPV